MAAAGIVAFGGYVPLRRIPRATIAAAMAWANPALKSRASGERSFCDWDEDSITMAVEATRSCLAGRDRAGISSFALASTTLPFADRDNAVVAAMSLSFPLCELLGHLPHVGGCTTIAWATYSQTVRTSRGLCAPGSISWVRLLALIT